MCCFINDLEAGQNNINPFALNVQKNGRKKDFRVFTQILEIEFVKR